MRAWRPPAWRVRGIAALACIVAVAGATAAEALRWTRAAQRVDRPAVAHVQAARPVVLTGPSEPKLVVL